MTKLVLNNLTKTYEGNSAPAVDQVNLTVKCGEMVAIVGPSGCGKSSLMSMIAGLVEPDSGDILFDETSVIHVPAHKRRASLMFQDHLLFPHFSVAQNVGFGLKMAGMSKPDRYAKIARFLELVKLDGLQNKRPDQLSGGQQQRVALARALITRPNILLLDEPLSNLDPQLRLDMRELICTLQSELNITTLFVTHDREEAVSMGDKIAVMLGGALAQFGTVEELYSAPQNLEIAKFLGFAPPIEGVIENDSFKADGLDLTSSTKRRQGAAHLVVRPENWYLIPAGEADTTNQIEGTLTQLIHLGDQVRLKVDVKGQEVQCLVRPRETGSLKSGDQVRLKIDPQHVICLPHS